MIFNISRQKVAIPSKLQIFDAKLQKIHSDQIKNNKILNKIKTAFVSMATGLVRFTE